MLGAFATGLCRHCTYSLTKLRIAELVIFGCPAFFFFVQGLQEATYLAQLPGERARIDMLVTPWLLLIFTYAMFIPNTWQRAAVVLGRDGPGARRDPCVYLWATIPAVRQIAQRLEYSGFISGQVLIAGIAVMIGIVGVHTIGTLRREAFAAKQLGQYRLKQRLGSGGMGEVYLAEHQMMKRPCAVKLIRPEKAGDPRMLARFEREVRATAKLSHWNSIDIYDYGRTADGTFYYVMEFLPGHNLGEIVEDYGPIPPARAVYLMDQVCSALDRGARHRPGASRHQAGQHLLRLSRRRVRRGQAARLRPGQAVDRRQRRRAADDGRHDHRLAAVHVARAGQRRGPRRRPQRHLFARRGDVLHAHRPAAVHGRQPAQGDDRPRVAGGGAAAADQSRDLPVELEEIVLRCLEKDPDHRFQDVAALQRALRERACSTTPGRATWPPSGGAATAAPSARSWRRSWSKRRRCKLMGGSPTIGKVRIVRLGE